MDISQRSKEDLTKLVQMELLCKSSQCCLDLFMWMSYFVINKKLQLHCFYPKERTFLIDCCVSQCMVSPRGLQFRHFIFKVSSFILMQWQSDWKVLKQLCIYHLSMSCCFTGAGRDLILMKSTFTCYVCTLWCNKGEIQARLMRWKLGLINVQLDLCELKLMQIQKHGFSNPAPCMEAVCATWLHGGSMCNLAA